MKYNTKVHKKTREIYDEQHKRILNNEKTMKRFLNMIQEPYFGLEPNYFKGKKIIDVGCGNTAKLLIRFHDFGCSDLVGLELGSDFKNDVANNFLKYKIPKDNFNLISGSVLELPCEDNSFDFVCCHGVLLHLNNFDEVEKGFKELSRICKKGGYLYVVSGLQGGLIENILPAIRDYYMHNKNFKNIIDNIHPHDFKEVVDFIKEKIFKHENEKLDLSFFDSKKLFDEDLCITIQNLMQAPVRLQISEEMFIKYYKNNNFDKIRRLKRYVKRDNIRRFFSPLHYYRDNRISKILYGSGNLEFIAKKKN